MILQSLVRYYETLAERGEVESPGWCKAKVSFALELSEDGTVIGVVPLKEKDERGKKTVWIPKEIRVPQMLTRSSGVAANFLCDNTSYFLGVDTKGKPERAIECFECAKEKHLEVLKYVESPAARAVKAYFETWKPELALVNPVLQSYLNEMMDRANLVFWFKGRYVQEDGEVQAAWETYHIQDEKETEGICLVTGERSSIARIHSNIKELQGAQSSGAALVSFNAPAFESYGKEQSYNAPVGNYAVYAYTTALNYLLKDRGKMSYIGDTAVVYWAEDGEEICRNVFAAVSEPVSDNQETVQGVFKNLELGRAVDVDSVQDKLNLDQNFYILGIAPNAARIAVRFFYMDSFGNILRHLKEHYDRMEIVRPATDSFAYLGAWRMMQETVNQKAKEKKPASGLTAQVYQAIISGGRYPNALYQTVLGRIRADQDNSEQRIYKITRGKAAIVKAYLLRNTNYEREVLTVALNENSKNAAYVMGREFAVLEEIQEKANPGINSTIKDRYFNAACATPGVVFPVLFKLKNSHIRKLESKGTQIYFEQMLTELEDKLEIQEDGTTWPKRLSLEEQGAFILGYYHQTQKRYEKKEKGEQK
ncbi:MAG TPA: type I-C CRISPR-associated protein Cas8c/Csd1 [Candidatus Merdisoma merdipullorum]|nr:type I-C CRISPR-associated protein Cas8c/Csd1 [Candidatus Merdisoma merdipullorum]